MSDLKVCTSYKVCKSFCSLIVLMRGFFVVLLPRVECEFLYANRRETLREFDSETLLF